MKKHYLSAACLLAGVAMFSSCSNEDDVINGGNNNQLVQTISLAVANTGDNFIGTRATAADRPLYSSEAKQSIENVKVVIYKLSENPNADEATITNAMYGADKEIVAQKLFTPWMNGGVSSSYNNEASGHGRQASWTLTTDDLIKEDGVYLAYAVGYNTDNYVSLGAFDALDKSSQATFPLTVDTKDEVKEIFAGSAIFKVTNDKKDQVKNPENAWHFNVSLTLHRQVAGAIGYFTNIPTKGNADHAQSVGSTLRLVASAKSKSAVFAGFNSVYTGDPSMDKKVKYVVNGYSESENNPNAKFYGSTNDDAYTVYSIELKDWFTEMDKNEDGILNGEDTWTKAIQGELNLKTGSVLGSSFLMPFQFVANKATFQLQMLDESGEIIRYWNIRLPQGGAGFQSQVGQTVTVVTKNGTSQAADAVESNINYSIVRNHLYTIGARDMGDNPTDPGTDPDKPQDLNNETLILKVNDNWEMVNHMDVD